MAKEIFSFPREHKIRIFELTCNEIFPKNQMVNSKVQQVQLNLYNKMKMALVNIQLSPLKYPALFCT